MCVMVVEEGDEIIFHSRSIFVKRKHPYINIGVVLCVVLGIMLPHVMGDNGAIRVRDPYRNRHASKIQPIHVAKAIDNKQDAEEYLRYYGYLNCSEALERRKRQLENGPWGDISEGGDDEDGDDIDDICDDNDYAEALRQYQLEWNISVTGILSPDTKMKMNEGRCGNSDKDLLAEIKEDDDDNNNKVNNKYDDYQDTKTRQKGGGGGDGGDGGDGKTRRGWSNTNGPNSGRRRKKRDIAEEQIRESSHSQPIWDILSHFTKWIISSSHGSSSSGLSSNEYYSSDSSEIDIMIEQQQQPKILDKSKRGSSFYNNEISVHLHLISEGKSDTYEHHKSLLSKLLLPQQKKTSRRREMLKEIKDNIKKTLKIKENQRDTLDRRKLQFDKESVDYPYSPPSERSHRSIRKRRDLGFNNTINITEADSRSHKLNHGDGEVLTYTIVSGGLSQKIPIDEQCSTIALAFRMWAEVTNLDFIPSAEKDITKIDILIGFGRSRHFGCSIPFDGSGGSIGHSNSRYIHFDEDECFKELPEDKDGCVPLLQTIIHEIGHVCGLGHKMDNESLMFPFVMQKINRVDYELPPSDRQAIQQIYGKCSGRFVAMFDWLHTDPDGVGGMLCMTPCECESQDWQYYTYFFRKNIYWLYLNRERRPRYGDPKPTKVNWKNLELPNAVVQTMQKSDTCWGKKHKVQHRMETIFFSGDKYYIWDDINDEVAKEGNISVKYGPMPGYNKSVPNNLDAALFDPRDNHLHFIKDNWVGVVDPFVDYGENGSCCVREYTFSDYFRFNATDYAEKNNETDVPELNGSLDTLYFRFSERVVYFFKHEYYWKADLAAKGNSGQYWSNPGEPVDLLFMGEWNQRWNDLCDVFTINHQHDFCSVTDLS